MEDAGGNIDKAIDYYKKELEGFPQDHKSAYNLAENLRKKGKNENAIQYYRQAIDNNPRFNIPYFMISKYYLDRTKKRVANDKRVSSIKDKRILNTQPVLKEGSIAGSYYSDLVGGINVVNKNGQLRLEFEHHPLLNANLSHWHYDTYQITWDKPQAWFNFGTIKFNSNNNLEVTGFDFDVPNDDIFFEELNPRRK